MQPKERVMNSLGDTEFVKLHRNDILKEKDTVAEFFLTNKAAVELCRFGDHAVVWIAAYKQLLVQIQPLEFALHRYFGI